MREPEARGFYARQSRTGDWQKSEEDEATEELATFHAALQTIDDEFATAVGRLAAASVAFTDSSEALAALLEGHAAYPPPQKRARSPPRDPQRGGTSAVHVTAVTTKAKCVYDTGLVYTKYLGILADLHSDRQRAIHARAADSVRRLQELDHRPGALSYHAIETLRRRAAHADTGVAAVAGTVTHLLKVGIAGAMSQHTRLHMPIDVPIDWAKKVDLILKSWADNPEELRHLLTNGP
jgi:hypothetical protein